MKKTELCALDIFRAVWKMLKNCKTIEEAKDNYRVLIPKLILEGAKDE